ncbi:hypothetical protein SSX86_005849 [Deinandra increscens subsp. villosa]|uniref:Uncharacterized protein n=1 Tax=Deinandra increscens subsp. villosa TaxID=3103831 RepID=A0AAP0DRA3_9ASTR
MQGPPNTLSSCSIMKLKTLTIYIFFFLISPLLEAFNNGDGEIIFEENEDTQIKRSDFPSGFLFGTATSAYQVEGAYLEDGKSLSTWDIFCHSVVGCGENRASGDIADDHYHMFLGDIELMHSLGIQAYRFSVSWARILPRGRFGEVNPAGIMFYNKIIDNLILKGIEPFVTIYHVDLPQELLDKYGSWLNPEMQEEFLYLAEICFKSFGDRVKYWITINEPKLVTDYGYESGTIPPNRCSEPFGKCLVGNSDPKQGGSVGLTVHSYMYEPLTNSELDREAAKRALAFHSAWPLDPSIFGDYPEEVKKCLGSQLPTFSLDEKNFMKNSIDFIGINHYSTSYAKDCTNSSCSATGNRAIRGFVETVGEREGVLIGELVGNYNGSYVVPRGMEEIVNLFKIRYNNMPMFVTENGYSSPDVHEQRVNVLMNDVKRVAYHTKYLAYLAKSIRGGADVRGYFAWSFLDSYEWLQANTLSSCSIMKLKTLTIYIFFFLISPLLEAFNNGDGEIIFEENEDTQIKRSDFPSGFLFGTATSAYQVEGAYLEDGKSLSTWDIFCHSVVGCGENRASGDIADDHYHMFLGDIELMHSLGIQAYRFSVSWARILPRGRFGEVNPAGIMFYNKIIDNLILKGIEPFVTIYHVDLPQELLDKYGSWLNPEMQEEFLYLAEICFKSFGDRVKYWITINEPKLVTDYGYESGTIPPNRCSEPFGKCLVGNSDLPKGHWLFILPGHLIPQSLETTLKKLRNVLEVNYQLSPLMRRIL